MSNGPGPWARTSSTRDSGCRVSRTRCGIFAMRTHRGHAAPQSRDRHEARCLVRSRFCEAALRKGLRAASRPGHEAASARLRAGRLEHQRKAVDAVAQAGRLRAVVEDMAEMAA